MIKEDGQVINFNNPKVQASITANTFAITGHAEMKGKRRFLLARLVLFGRGITLCRFGEESRILFAMNCRWRQKYLGIASNRAGILTVLWFIYSV